MDSFDKDFIEQAKKRKKRVEFKLPERKPDEEPTTEKQIAYIKHLAPNLV